jgi:triosephosphate isomerase
MNTTRREAVKLAAGVCAGWVPHPNVRVAVCPPYPYLDAVREVVRGTSIALGAQNVYFQRQGAFTGEVSANMLADMACKYVIIGHSERRHQMGETDEHVQRKIEAALEAGLDLIVCVGETLAQREASETLDVVTRQVTAALDKIWPRVLGRVVLAYEPVWAIGTGHNATPAQAEEVHALIRKILSARYNAAAAARVPVQYGGSVNPKNARELLAQPNVNGALVGGASLKAEDFLAIANAAVALAQAE